MQIQTQQSFTVADVKCRQETSNAPETFKFMEMWSFVREVPLYFFKVNNEKEVKAHITTTSVTWNSIQLGGSGRGCFHKDGHSFGHAQLVLHFLIKYIYISQWESSRTKQTKATATEAVMKSV